MKADWLHKPFRNDIKQLSLKPVLLICFIVFLLSAGFYAGERFLFSGDYKILRDQTAQTAENFKSPETVTLTKAKLLAEMTELRALRSDYSEWYVAPNGNLNGKGTTANPWDLATALAGGPSGKEIKPGDVVWLRGGIYKGAFTSRVKGKSDLPVNFRQYPGEYAVIDKREAGREAAALAVRAPYVWFWDFEVTNSFSDRSSNDPNGEVNPWRGSGINIWAPNTKYINLIVRDNGHGFGLWNEEGGTEIYGCLIFNNGNNKKEHGVYGHNAQGTQTIAENIIFNNAGYGLHVYANSPKSKLSGFDISGNTVFNNGAISPEDQAADQILVGGVVGSPASRIALRENFVYTAPDAPRVKNRGVRLGYEDTENLDASLVNNYIVSRVPLKILWWKSIEARGNTIVSDKSVEIELPENFDAAGYRLDSNRFFGKARQVFKVSQKKASYDFEPSGSASQLSTMLSGQPEIFIRANKYEKGRAMLVIYNPGMKESVTVELRSFLRKGDNFEIRDAQNYFDDPVMQSVYDGGDVLLPMKGKRTTPPLGETSQMPSHTNTDVGVFLIRKIVRK